MQSENPESLTKFSPRLTYEGVSEMRKRFEQGISCDEIGRNATFWLQLMDFYLATLEKRSQ